MKKRIESYIAPAIAQIRSRLATTREENGRTIYEVNEKYDGYASSLGPTIINSGLKPALSLYTDTKDNVRPKRYEILNLISGILVQDGVPIRQQQNNDDLLEYSLQTNPQVDEKELRAKVLDAVVALKLAFRNFKQVKS